MFHFLVITLGKFHVKGTPGLKKMKPKN